MLVTINTPKVQAPFGVSLASYRYPISWEAFLDPSDSYFLFAEEQGYHK
jgi:hypothetical protein